MIIDAEKLQDLHSACWRPKKLMVQSQPASESLKTRRANGVSSSPKACQFETQEKKKKAKVSVQVQSQEKDLCSNSSSPTKGGLSYSWEGWAFGSLNAFT